MRDGIYIVDGDGHILDRPNRCYEKYLTSIHAKRSVGLFERF